MKRIEAIIRKTKFAEVKEALYEAGVTFFSYLYWFEHFSKRYHKL
jgi:nitrogen regulatory protein PII